MIFAKPNHVPVFVLDKLRLLFELLKERKREFEGFSANAKNNQLRIMVLCLAQECNQYAHEIFGQLETMSGRFEQYPESIHLQDMSLLCEEGDILETCQISEKKMIVAYRNVLNEPALNQYLRSLLRNQLNGLTCAFTQIKLLNASMCQR